MPVFFYSTTRFPASLRSREFQALKNLHLDKPRRDAKFSSEHLNISGDFHAPRLDIFLQSEILPISRL